MTNLRIFVLFVFGMISFISNAQSNSQHELPNMARRMNPAVVYVGENANWKLYYDRNITYETQRNQATVYLLMESKSPLNYTKTDVTGKIQVYQYIYSVQRTDIDCNRGIYIAQLHTFFDMNNGQIIQEDISGEPYKVNRGSLVDTVYRTICGTMR